MKIYAATSWRNKHHESIVALLRAEGHRVYDFRHPNVDGPVGAPEEGFSWREIDPNWQKWTPEQYREAMKHPIAQQGYRSDSQAMAWADACVITLPCGRSAHLEAGWMMGRGKPTAVYLPPVYYKCPFCDGSGLVPGDRSTLEHCGCDNGTRQYWNFEPELMYLLGDSSAAHIVTSNDELCAWLRFAAALVDKRNTAYGRMKRNVTLGIMKALSNISGVDMIDSHERHDEAYKVVSAWLREYDWLKEHDRGED